MSFDDLSCDFTEADLPVFVPIRDQWGSLYDSPGDAARCLGVSSTEIRRQLAGKPSRLDGRYQFRFDAEEAQTAVLHLDLFRDLVWTREIAMLSQMFLALPTSVAHSDRPAAMP